MIIPKYARYNYCVYKAYEFLNEFSIADYPINAFEIISNMKWGLITYSELARRRNCSVDDVIKAFGSQDGFTIYDEYNYTIAYNDLIKPKNRILFTLFHEIGHIYLNHLKNFESARMYRGFLTKDEYKVLENESNAFARNVLAPAIILYRTNNIAPKIVSSRFGITKRAAEARLDLLNTDLSLIHACGIEDKAQAVYNRFYYKRTCKTCGHYFIIPNAKYCPICGGKKLKNERGKNMIYKSMDTYSNRKLKVCPRCGNEETNIEGFYCQICGALLVNYCDDRDSNNVFSAKDMPCGSEVPVNARYCPKCGSRTTFYNDGLLEDWNTEKNNNDIFNIPNDDELPFV